MCHGSRRRALDSTPRRFGPKPRPLVVASLMMSMISSVLGAPVETIAVVQSMSQIAVTTSGEVSMMSSMRSSPVTRPSVVMPGVVMLDPVAASVQRVGEVVVTGERCHECQQIEVDVDVRAPMAVIGLRAGSEEQAA